MQLVAAVGIHAKREQLAVLGGGVAYHVPVDVRGDRGEPPVGEAVEHEAVEFTVVVAHDVQAAVVAPEDFLKWPHLRKIDVGRVVADLSVGTHIVGCRSRFRRRIDMDEL